MRLEFKQQALEDLSYWVETDRRLASKIIKLISETIKTPFTGTGKPEPLGGNLSGWWSRRINQEHRLVYLVEKDVVVILNCRYHY